MKFCSLGVLQPELRNVSKSSNSQDRCFKKLSTYAPSYQAYSKQTHYGFVCTQQPRVIGTVGTDRQNFSLYAKQTSLGANVMLAGR